MVLIYIALLPKVLYSVDSHSPIHAHIQHRIHHNHAGRPPAHQEQLGWGRLAQGHHDTQLGGAEGDRTSNLAGYQPTRSTSWANATPRGKSWERDKLKVVVVKSS